MRVILQNLDKQYLTEGGLWSNSIREAKDFKSFGNLLLAHPQIGSTEYQAIYDFTEMVGHDRLNLSFKIVALARLEYRNQLLAAPMPC